MQLQLDAIHDRSGVYIVRCNGRIIFGPEADAFTQTCEDAFLKGADLVVNLTEVRSIDNHGVGALVGLLASAQGIRRDVRLVLPKGPGKVTQLLKLMKVYDKVQVFSCEEDALGSFRPQAYAVAEEQAFSTQHSALSIQPGCSLLNGFSSPINFFLFL